MLQQLTDAQLDRKILDLETEKNRLKREVMYSDGFVTFRGRMLNKAKTDQSHTDLELSNAKAEKERRASLKKRF